MHVDIKKVVKEIELFMKKEAQKLNLEHLDGPQGQVVCFLAQQKDKETYQKHIEEALSLDKSVASRLLKRMEKNEFIQIVSDKKDKRLKRLLLTSKGLEKSKQVQQFFDIILTKMLNHVAQEDITTVFKVFEQIETNLKEKDDA